VIRWNPLDYQGNSSAQLQWARELIAKLDIRPTAQVLDIGCGDGKITAEIARTATDGRVVGMDSSRDMIQFAVGSFPPADWPNLRFLLGEAAAMEFREEFDVVFSNAALHWVVDHRPVLHGIARALKPGGKCLLQMGGRGNAAGIIEVLDMPGPVLDKWGGYLAGMSFPYGFYGPEDYMPWLLDAGLTPIRVELLERDMAQRGADGLAGWVRTTWMPYTQRVPEDIREQFVSDVVHAYLADHPLDEQGMAHVGMVRLEVEAAKP